jgi:hypothetical protein
MRAFGMALLLWSRVVAADSTVYPTNGVERPIVLPAGITEASISINLSEVTTTTGDEMTETSIGSELDIGVAHSLGPVEVFGRLLGNSNGPRLSTTGLLKLGRGAVVATIATQVARRTPGYQHSQSLGYAWKMPLVRQRFAVVTNGGGTLTEFAFRHADGSPVEGVAFDVSAGVFGQVQLMPQLALRLGPNVSVPLAQPAELDRKTSLLVLSELVFSLRRWDFFAQFLIANVTRSRDPFGSFGFVHRWGN